MLSDDHSVISGLKPHFDIDVASSKSALFDKIGGVAKPLIVIDCDVKGCGGISTYREIIDANPKARAILLSSSVTIPEAVEGAKAGILDFIKKPFETEKLLGSVNANLIKEDHARLKFRFPASAGWLAGGGASIRALFDGMETSVREKKNVVFLARPGVNVRDLVDLIHSYSGKGRKLVEVDILPFSRDNAENIFWTVLQEAAFDAGTLFLKNFDHVDEKQQRSIIDYVRSKISAADIRIVVSAWHEVPHISHEWMTLRVPSLGERMEDMPAMLRAYMIHYSGKYGKEIGAVSIEALGLLTGYDWPGDYRELECVLEASILVSDDGMISLKSLQANEKMLFDIISAQSPELLDFRKEIESGMVNIVYSKTGSESLVASLLDIPKERVSDKINGRA